MQNCVRGKPKRFSGCAKDDATTCSGIITKGGEKMSNTWLAAESFERGQRLIQATNTLAISVKLALAGKHDPERVAVAEQARDKLRPFLTHLPPCLPQPARSPPPHAPPY